MTVAMGKSVRYKSLIWLLHLYRERIVIRLNTLRVNNRLVSEASFHHLDDFISLTKCSIHIPSFVMKQL